jgi:hypothetical protein
MKVWYLAGLEVDRVQLGRIGTSAHIDDPRPVEPIETFWAEVETEKDLLCSDVDG